MLDVPSNIAALVFEFATERETTAVADKRTGPPIVVIVTVVTDVANEPELKTVPSLDVPVRETAFARRSGVEIVP